MHVSDDETKALEKKLLVLLAFLVKIVDICVAAGAAATINFNRTFSFLYITPLGRVLCKKKTIKQIVITYQREKIHTISNV